jgi:hypothetical protein
MRLIFGLVIFLCAQKSYSQSTLVKTDYYKNSKQVYSKYHVLESDTSIREGEAIIYRKIDEHDYGFFNNSQNQERLVMAKGLYKGNYKVGKWAFFYDRKLIYDFDTRKLVNNLQFDYPVLAQELGIQGDVIIQYDIDATFGYKNFNGISGDSLLMKGAISDFKRFSRARADMLKEISVVVGDCRHENVTDTVRYRLQ